MQRPSAKECCNKLRQALAAVSAGNVQFPLTKHLAGDLDALAVDDEEGLVSLLGVLLAELQKADSLKCYVGGRPPQRSYEPEIKNLELWAFAWPSHHLGKRIYLKFALKTDVFIYVDCHEDNP